MPAARLALLSDSDARVFITPLNDLEESETDEDVNTNNAHHDYLFRMPAHANVCTFGDERLLPMFLCAQSDKNMRNVLCKPCMDSGASTCFFNELKSFQTLRSMPEAHVSLGEQGRSYQVNNMGSVQQRTKVNGRTHILTLKDVIYAPQAPGNFISLSYLDRKMGMKIYIGDGCMRVCNRIGKPIAHAPLNKMTNLYDLSCEIVLNPRWRDEFAHLINAPLRLNALTTAELMHRRFGHCGMQMLNRTLKKLNVSCVRPKKVRCTACDLTGTKRPQVRARNKRKQQRKKSNCKNDTVSRTADGASHHANDASMIDIVEETSETVDTESCVRAIHSDVKTMPRSRRGYKFFVVFVEQKTRFCRITKFKRKSELADTVRFLRSDLLKNKELAQLWSSDLTMSRSTNVTNWLTTWMPKASSLLPVHHTDMSKMALRKE